MLCVAFCLFKTLHNLHYEQIGKEVRCIEDELPFEIPDSWEWTTLGMVLEIARGGSPRPIKDYLTESANGINWIKIGDTEKGGKYINQVKEKIKPEGASKSRLVHKGDFLLTNSMSFGRPYILNVDGCIHDGWLVLSDGFKVFDKDYLYYLLSSKFAYYQFCESVSGAVVKNLNSDKVAISRFAIPPINEQKRIVNKIKSLEPLIEKYEVVENELYELDSSIKSQLKKSILQYAIEGKLVPQDPNDEPASVLLERIHKEKSKLIAEGKTKKDKNESIIYRRDNSYYEKQGKNEVCIDKLIPFDIPNNWIWTRLSNIANTLGGYAFKSTEYTNTGVRVIRISDFDNGGILDDEYKCYHEEEALKKYILKENDILLCMTGGTVGKVCVNNRKTKQYLNQRVAAIRTSDLIYYRYIYKVITSNYIQSIINKSKTSTNDNISMDTINDFLIPLPPFNEQIRICEAIDKM